MDTAWRFRIMIFTALALMLFGDFFGYGSVRGVKSDPNQPTATSTAGKFQEKNAEIEISDDTELNELSTATLKEKRDFIRSQLTDAIKDSCLPKMLCEMASKADYMLTDKERDLLQLIRSSTMSLNGPPSKWHFAAHMGELFQYTGDDLSMSGPMGCANLWPNCPISSKKLMKLSYKVKI